MRFPPLLGHDKRRMGEQTIETISDNLFVSSTVAHIENAKNNLRFEAGPPDRCLLGACRRTAIPAAAAACIASLLADLPDCEYAEGDTLNGG